MSLLPPTGTPNGDRTHKLGMCLHQESHLQPFGVHDKAPTNLARALITYYLKYIPPEKPLLAYYWAPLVMDRLTQGHQVATNPASPAPRHCAL